MKRVGAMNILARLRSLGHLKFFATKNYFLFSCSYFIKIHISLDLQGDFVQLYPWLNFTMHECIEKRRLLRTPSERQRLLEEVPRVIPDLEDNKDTELLIAASDKSFQINTSVLQGDAHSYVTWPATLVTKLWLVSHWASAKKSVWTTGLIT